MTVNRELTPIEEGFEIINQTGGTLNVVTISRIIGLLDEVILRQALDIVQCRHPLLNCRIIKSFNSLRFETAAIKIPLRSFNHLDYQNWTEVVVAEMNQKMESHKGLARCVLVKSQNENNVVYLITTLHHAISDGLSTVQLHSEILTYCQKIAAGEIINQVDSLHVLPPIQELLPDSARGWGSDLQNIFFLLKLTFQYLWYNPKSLDFQEYVPIKSRRSGMVHKQLDQELTVKLVNFCRKKNTTVQGALCAALMFAVAQEISGNERKDISLSCTSYISLRKHLRSLVSENNLGVLASAITSFHTLRVNTHFWNLAREVRENLAAELKSDDIFSITMMYKNMIEFLLANPNLALTSVAVTNIGQVKIPKFYGPFELTEISFVPAQAIFGGVLSAAVTTFDNRMILNFMFSLPSNSQNLMEELADNVIACLKNACEY
ncbi:alcohol acetyltransferase [Sphaerospermopsis aphanizomenoides BCCUSP55]|uniref:phthiocerol/phthiodiolone dimycocerosyl transferase family protein n=1 Tax=Sphaerospermopsis aphanizomenoides TaxID=459663 RepID=UPI0019049011|nr:alcohol acetyltransferase [Sphaerospermopsis aphanizomenoides]MBK1988708.1 alcohol acetyltransferase [Sphaerospermopsis aphanizomenoides BCCUSP55]